ncbi:MAG: ATP-dependent helicase [Oscillospiraceae bacterium]|nr:ATP-dependent helicase [Oscillospiraceae bacterium]
MKIIIAGAGAGKTTTMADTIIKLRAETESSKNIYCITFTNNAVMCINEKLKKCYGEIPSNVIVSTIHSFLYREFIRPYYYLLYGKQYERISTAELPQEPAYKNAAIKRLEGRNVLHQTVIPERAKWIAVRKSDDRKHIKEKRTIIMSAFEKYCGGICIDEAQDIDSDMQLIIETLNEIGISLILMGDPKQDLRGHKCLRLLAEKYAGSIEYLDVCHRCPQKHLKISNTIVDDKEKQYSKKTGGTITVCFEKDVSCEKLLQQEEFDLSYISKKYGKYSTHSQERGGNIKHALAEEIEAVMQSNHSDKNELVISQYSYYFAEKLLKNYRKLNDKKKAMNATFKNYSLNGKAYGIIINLLTDTSNTTINDTVIVSSIDSIKGQEGENCLFILTKDMASYLFKDKTEDTATKNRLYVALTRSLNKLTIFITEEVETKYGRANIFEFFKKYLD